MDSIRWGIAGPGRIADALVPDFMHVPRADVVAVGSRSEDRARAFASRHGIARAHGSYRALIDDPEVDVIYIATPHPFHRDIALAAIEAGKAVLVEKAFTATFAGTREVVQAARQHGVFAMEAVWTRFQPAIEAAREVIAWGRIGDVTGVQADLCAFRAYTDGDRLFAPDLGGGATLDLGVYLINLADFMLGEATSITAAGRLYDNGVDAAASYLLTYASGATASLTCGFDAHGPGRMIVTGTNGWIEIEPRFHHPSMITIHRTGVLPRVIEAPPSGRGYSHEFAEATRRIAAGETESPTMPLSDTLEVMRVLEACLRQSGVYHRELDLVELRRPGRR